MIRFVIIAAFFLLVSTVGSTQSKKLLKKDIPKMIDGWTIGIVPSALFNSWNGYQIKTSYGFNGFEISVNTGYLAGFKQDDFYQGYRIRSAIKYYFYQNNHESIFVGFGGLIRQVNWDTQGTFSRFDDSFFQNFDFELDQRMLGVYSMAGARVPTWSDKLFVDVALGIGRSVLDVKNLGVPSDATLSSDFWFLSADTTSAGRRDYPIFFFHIAIVYAI